MNSFIRRFKQIGGGGISKGGKTMLHKITLLLAALMLFLPSAGAETAEGGSISEPGPAEVAENPYLGAWEVLYYIQDGKAYTPEELEYTDTIIVNEDCLTAREGMEEYTGLPYEIDGQNLVLGDTRFTLESDDLMIGKDKTMSYLLARIDPMVLNNPFIGTWKVLCTVNGSTVRDMADAAEALIVFAADSVQLIDENNADVYACTYSDGTCTIYSSDGSTYALCTVTGDGLLRFVDPSNERKLVIGAREDAVPPDYVTRFLGQWHILTVLDDGELIPDLQEYNQQRKLPVIDTFYFDWPFVTQAVGSNRAAPAPCTYTEEGCIIDYGYSQAICTIDENGLMCIREEDGWTLFLVRTQSEEPAE